MCCTPKLPMGQFAIKDRTASCNADLLAVWKRGRGGHTSTLQRLVGPVPITPVTTGPNESRSVTLFEVQLLGTVHAFSHAVRAQASGRSETVAGVLMLVCTDRCSALRMTAGSR
ncbi:hypothetical protein ABL78_7529 [Leptomonas seymouri]|uniref:Uncharacterized protein n=1 Tax=Leptomonas seymouri TaxID=5684 RepID=A0A0N1I0G9_LEPSE|nr:hypothetical protein ABL78_7529 [Leptomonas seymouri]|eukprot:KPI83431.1 hypothetical protein ABL78_7529 [Leptomonas seymouri]